MTWHELTKQCVESLSHPERSGGMPAAIVLKSPRRGGLFPKGGGPRPKVLGSEWGPNHETIYLLWYEAEKVLAAMCARGIIRYSSTGTEIQFEVLVK
jgi:hypothetical protein